VAVNLSDDEVRVDLAGQVLLSTADREDPATLGPWEGFVLGS
jgi:hypothetical protein